VVYIVAFILDAAIGTGFVFYAVAVLPSIALSIRRLHDTGKVGGWLLLTLVPFGGIVLLVFVVMDSRPDNQYGPSAVSALAGRRRARCRPAGRHRDSRPFGPIWSFRASKTRWRSAGSPRVRRRRIGRSRSSVSGTCQR